MHQAFYCQLSIFTSIDFLRLFDSSPRLYTTSIVQYLNDTFTITLYFSQKKHLSIISSKLWIRGILRFSLNSSRK